MPKKEKEKNSSIDFLETKFAGKLSDANIKGVFSLWNQRILHLEELSDPNKLKNTTDEAKSITTGIDQIISSPEHNELAQKFTEYEQRYNADRELEKAEISLKIESKKIESKKKDFSPKSLKAIGGKTKKYLAKKTKKYFTRGTFSEKKPDGCSYQDIMQEKDPEIILAIAWAWEAGFQLKESVIKLKEASFKSEINNDEVAKLVITVNDSRTTFKKACLSFSSEYKSACLMNLDRYIKETESIETEAKTEKGKVSPVSIEKVQSLYLKTKVTESSEELWETMCKKLNVDLQNEFSAWKSKFGTSECMSLEKNESASPASSLFSQPTSKNYQWARSDSPFKYSAAPKTNNSSQLSPAFRKTWQCYTDLYEEKNLKQQKILEKTYSTAFEKMDKDDQNHFCNMTTLLQEYIDMSNEKDPKKYEKLENEYQTTLKSLSKSEQDLVVNSLPIFSPKIKLEENTSSTTTALHQPDEEYQYSTCDDNIPIIKPYQTSAEPLYGNIPYICDTPPTREASAEPLYGNTKSDSITESNNSTRSLSCSARLQSYEKPKTNLSAKVDASPEDSYAKKNTKPVLNNLNATFLKKLENTVKTQIPTNTKPGKEKTHHNFTPSIR